MNEVYPDRVINQLTLKYDLPKAAQEGLREILLFRGMEELVNAKQFNIELLFKRVEEGSSQCYLCISNSAAKKLIETFNVIKLTGVFLEGKLALSDIVFWLSDVNSFHFFVLSALAAQSLVEAPNNLVSLQQLAKNNPKALREWDRIRDEIDVLNALPLRETVNRKMLANDIGSRLHDLPDVISDCTPLFREYRAISKRLHETMNERNDFTEKSAKTHFEKYLQAQKKIIINISTFSKPGGDQLGCGVIIRFKDSLASAEKEIRYYVKTHQHGSTSRGASTKPVDPKELFVYKLLEYMGIGPKAHFFFNPLSEGGFYIATQDAGYTKTVGKHKLFETYDALKADFYKQHQAGTFKSEEAIRALSCTDILSRVLVLFDVTTNAANFGRVTINARNHKWKIVDFRHDSRPSYMLPGIFEGFIQGNGMYNYSEFLGYLLRDRGEKDRIATAMQVISELQVGRLCHDGKSKKLSFEAAVKKAFYEIVSYIRQNAESFKLDIHAVLGELTDVSNIDLKAFSPEKIGDLGRYVKAIEENFANLAAGVSAKYQEYSSSLSQLSSNMKKP